MGESGAVLEYAAGTPRPQWRRWAVVIVGLLLVGMVISYRQPILRRGRLLYWQHRCLTYTRPARTPVLTTQPSAAQDRDYLPYPRGYPPRPLMWYGTSPECWRELEGLRWPGLQGARSGFGLRTVFLHERVSPAGHRRLVRVESIYGNALQPQYGYDVTVLAPGTLWRDPKEVSPRFGFAASGRYIPADYYFGQPDLDDASHFTIEYAVAGKPRGTVDAWLRDDETVVFKLRDPASTQSVSTVKWP
jgi:hypothetical protein